MKIENFYNDKTKIEIDKKQGIVTFTNIYPNGEIQKMTLKLKDKMNNIKGDCYGKRLS